MRVYEFDTSTNAWRQKGLDFDGDNDGARIQEISLNYNGNRIAISAPNFNNRRGRVRVHEYTMNAWHQLGSDFVGSSAYDREGYRIALNDDGDRIAISAPFYDSGRGRTHVFQYDITSNWTQSGPSIEGGAVNVSRFGHSLSMSGDGSRIAVSAINVTNSLEKNFIRVFEYNTASWAQIGSTIKPNTADYPLPYFPVSLDETGARLAVGALVNDYSGYVRVYHFDTEWMQIGDDIIGEANHDHSGSSISLSGNGTRLAIGAYKNDRNNVDTSEDGGHVRVYELS